MKFYHTSTRTIFDKFLFKYMNLKRKKTIMILVFNLSVHFCRANFFRKLLWAASVVSISRLFSLLFEAKDFLICFILDPDHWTDSLKSINLEPTFYGYMTSAWMDLYLAYVKMVFHSRNLYVQNHKPAFYLADLWK